MSLTYIRTSLCMASDKMMTIIYFWNFFFVYKYSVIKIFSKITLAVFGWCLGADQATSHYLNQWWPRLVTHMCASRPRWVNRMATLFSLWDACRCLDFAECDENKIVTQTAMSISLKWYWWLWYTAHFQCMRVFQHLSEWSQIQNILIEYNIQYARNIVNDTSSNSNIAYINHGMYIQRGLNLCN